MHCSTETNELTEAAAILAKLTDICRDVFDDPGIILTQDTTAEDIPAWDSMAQVRLAVEIEHRFGIKIKSATMEQMRSVRGLLALIGQPPAAS
ncbi:MAG TPA: acyl carrier protein [Rhodopila sp.]|jgi:acyl carrier protein|nr:acyl carrier protein [Rhodopila sp.]